MFFEIENQLNNARIVRYRKDTHGKMNVNSFHYFQGLSQATFLTLEGYRQDTQIGSQQQLLGQHGLVALADILHQIRESMFMQGDSYPTNNAFQSEKLSTMSARVNASW
ncbi:hypothetical protein KQX54_000686 [Cotesia glomerata]|uniref:Uncharacterized protein n=1 Tax=Cotesia glomerata TaxID=32391 RepID=A0AAV7IZR1_COTGL|nr:hypothetical protein KQX54_000686 [Cotesia glomerata]